LTHAWKTERSIIGPEKKRKAVRHRKKTKDGALANSGDRGRGPGLPICAGKTLCGEKGKRTSEGKEEKVGNPFCKKKAKTAR